MKPEWLLRPLVFDRIGVNGTIHAVTRTFEEGRSVAKFSALVPETAFQPGKNLGGAVVKDGFVQFHGWAADVKNSQLVEAIWVFVDGKFFYSGETHVARPDVVKAYKNTALHGAGFDYTLVGGLLGCEENTLQLF